MDSEASFRDILTTATFSAKAQNAIIEFCCSLLTELANLPRLDMDAGIANLHKSLSNAALVRDRVRLNATKCLILHSIRVHFLDRIRCQTPLSNTDITALVHDNISKLRPDYI